MEANQEAPQSISFDQLVELNEQSLKESGMVNLNLEEPKVELEEVKQDDNTFVPPVTTEEKEEPITPAAPVVEEEEKAPVAQAESVQHYSNLAKTLLKEGSWKDVLIENEDGTEVKLSEMDDLDEKTFLSILSEQRKISKEEIDENYIPVKGIDEDKKRLINIISNGGDVREIFKSEAHMKKPYEDLDISDLQTKQNILYSFYITAKGLDKEEASDLVVKATKDLSLDQKTEQVVSTAQQLYSENLKKKEKETIDNRIAEEKAVKEYKKNLSGLFKEDGIEDGLTRTLVEAATKPTPDGLYIDTVYEKMMKDPAQAKDLVFFMLEKEKFLSKLGANVKRDTNIGNLKKIKLVQDTGKTNNVVQEEERPVNVFSNIVLPD